MVDFFPQRDGEFEWEFYCGSRVFTFANDPINYNTYDIVYLWGR